MALGICPNEECRKIIDIDGFAEHGIPTLFYCECGKIYDMPIFDMLVEVPKERVDLSGLGGKYPIPENSYSAEEFSRGLFIDKNLRLKKL